MTDLDALLANEPIATPTVNVATERKCRRHRWVRGTDGVMPEFGVYYGDGPDPGYADWRCDRCGKPQDTALSRRGKNNRNRGNAIERAVAAQLGLRRVGQFGGPDDVSGAMFAGQVKSGTAFSEKLWRWLKSVPVNADQTAILVVTDAPGPGHRRRAIVVVDLADWVSLHGPEVDAA